MRADERQAGAAYTYAWWLTGDDDAAVAAIRAAFARLGEADLPGDDPLAVLLRAVRGHIGQARPMCPASELALLRDGLEVDLDTAAQIAGIGADDVTVQLAHGRLEGLLETVREDFEHPERLGGLAVGNPPDIAHARQCPSCARARTLLERGRNELREVVTVSAPPGLLSTLVAGTPPEVSPAAAPAAEDVTAPPAEDEPAVADTAPAEVAPPAEDEPAVADTAPTEVAPPADDEPAVAPTEVAPPPQPDEPAEPEPTDEVAPPTGEELMQRPALLRPEPAARKVPSTPVRRRTAGVLAAAGLVVIFGLVTALFAMDDTPGPAAPTPAPEQPAVEQPTPDGDSADPDPAETDTPGFGPQGEASGFAVTGAGLLRSGEDEFAQPGGEVESDEPLRVAVDYRNAVEGVTVSAIWRVDGEVYLRLRAVLAGSSSRHVWGLPVPPDGWPEGAHRILITTEEGLAAAIDFHVRE